MVVASGPVPVGLKTALSDAPGFPVLGFQFALMFQLLAPGLATFQTNVVAREIWEASNVERSVSPANRRVLRIIDPRVYLSSWPCINRIFVLGPGPTWLEIGTF